MIPVLIDTDPGIDDAYAIGLAARSPECHVVALTTLNGNVGLEAATRNALALTHLLDLDARVHIGAAAGLDGRVASAEEIHGPGGLGGIPLPTHDRTVAAETAVEAIVAASHRYAGDLVLLPIGPLTNIALALEADPSLPERIRSTVIMGGSRCGGNATEHAEFNTWADPIAAHRVLASGLRQTWVMLDVTLQCMLPGAFMDSVRDGGDEVARFFARICDHYRTLPWALLGGDGLQLHDPLAMAVVLHPAFVTTEPMRLEVDLTETRWGETRRGDGDANADVVVTVDAERVVRLVAERCLGIAP